MGGKGRKNSFCKEDLEMIKERIEGEEVGREV